MLRIQDQIRFESFMMRLVGDDEDEEEDEDIGVDENE